MRSYRQPTPPWMQRKIHDEQAKADHAFQQNVTGPLMGFDDDGCLEAVTSDDPLDAPAMTGQDDKIACADDVVVRSDHTDKLRRTIGKAFILAGRAIFTVSGRDSRFTYKITRKDPEPDSRYTSPTFFVKVRTGEDFSYLGILNPATGEVKLTKASKVTSASPSFKALTWTLAHVWAGRPLPEPAFIVHEGACGRCGRALTTPASVVIGFGPDCADILGIPYPSELN